MNLEMTPTELSSQQPTDPNRGFENPLYDTAHQVGTLILA